MPPDTADTRALAAARRSAATSRRDDERRVAQGGTSVERQLELRPGHGHEALVLEFQFRADEGDLERRGAAIVADQRVHEAVRYRIHRAGHRDAARLESPAAGILNRRQHAWLDDVKHARRKVAGYCHSSYSRRSIA
jgi:hypothetical protein